MATVSLVHETPAMSRPFVFILASLCALAVANIYYAQPLLFLINNSLPGSAGDASLIATVVQLAYAAGLVFFVPIGDLMNRRKLLIVLLGCNALGSAWAAYAGNLTLLIGANVLIGLTAVSAQIILPAASTWSSEADRGRTMGTLLSGLFAGVLFGRALAGFVGDHWGWRAMYSLAALIDIGLLAVVFTYFPNNRPNAQLSYGRLLASLWDLLVSQPVLRKACVAGALMFGAFSALWGALANLLAQQPFNYGSEIVGLFGFTGLAGMFASPKIGMLADRIGATRVVGFGALAIALGFGLIALAGHGLWLLIPGMLLLDIGSRSGLLGNQLRIYTLAPAMRSRLNTAFMCTYFLGGAVGTRLGGIIALDAGWTSLAALGASLAVIAGLSTLGSQKHQSS